jgi:hypothetical protein
MGSTYVPCNCVLRAIFRACYARFRHCAAKQECLTQKSFEYLPYDGDVAVVYSRQNEEFVADFEAIAKRNLNELEHKLFRYHYLLGADGRLCRARLGLDRGAYFHMLYAIQEKLGRAFRETRPYPLFPVYEYYEEVRQPVVSCLPVENSQDEEIETVKVVAVAAAKRSADVMPIRARRMSQPYPADGLPGRRRKIA